MISYALKLVRVEVGYWAMIAVSVVALMQARIQIQVWHEFKAMIQTHIVALIQAM